MKNTLKRIACLIVLTGLSINWAGVRAAPIDNMYYFSNLGLKDGLSQLSVLKIYQDSKGYMWFGTRNGLNKFDGGRMVVYKHQSGDSLSLSDNHVTALVEDNRHNLWVGTSHGLNRLDLKTDKITPYAGKKYAWLRSGVRSLFVDSKNRLWVGTSRGLWLFVRETDTFRMIDLEGELAGEFISVITETSDHRLVIGTECKGVYLCDLNLKSVTRYTKGGENDLLPDNNIADVYEDNRKQLWVATTYGGLVKLDRTNKRSTVYTAGNTALSTNSIRCLSEADGFLFIGTFDGLYTIDLATDTLKVHSKAKLERGNLSHFSIYSICVDNSGSVWVGTYSGGVNYLSKYNNRFVFHEPDKVFNVLLGVYGSMVCKAPDCLYIATEGVGLLEYNLHSDTYRYYLYDTSSSRQYSRNIIKSVMLEGDTVWCGTAHGDIYRFDTRTKKFSRYYTFPQKTSVYSILRSADRSLWVATSKPSVGLVKLTAGKQMQARFAIAGAVGMWRPGSTRCLSELSEGVYLIGSRNNGLYKYDENKKECTNYHVHGEGSTYLPSDYVTFILRSSSGQIWIGTFGGGISLFDEQKGIVKNITSQQGLTDTDVCAIAEDTEGNLWISTNSAIFKYNPGTEKIHPYPAGSVIGAQEFTPHSGISLPGGQICFSASNGFVTFDPADLQLNSFLPPLVFTNLVVNNKTISPVPGGILQVTLDDAGKIELAYDENNISIGYCALNYVYAFQNQYAYRLKGHDKEWNYVGNRQEAYFTNLEPGKYVFEVKAANNDGVWSDRVRTLRIVVRPPFWKTWYAFLFYALSFFGACFLVMYYILKKKKLEQALLYEHLEQQRAEEFHQTKMRMFTNFSHELRTPLTLIISPLQELLQRTGFDAAVRNKLSLMYNNSQRLLLLVNQLMDLRKNQAGKMRLKIAEDDICSFLMEIYYAFNQIAIGKNIGFRYAGGDRCMAAWFDKSLLEKVVFNLLSNAFKYTPEGGCITLSVGKVRAGEIVAAHRDELNGLPGEAALVHLTVCDTGTGIPDEKLKNIFIPFYRIEAGRAKDVAGTGIGLSLTQSIVQLHHGTVWAENDERGALFFM